VANPTKRRLVTLNTFEEENFEREDNFHEDDFEKAYEQETE
jgi:hypothetical protein